MLENLKNQSKNKLQIMVMGVLLSGGVNEAKSTTDPPENGGGKTEYYQAEQIDSLMNQTLIEIHQVFRNSDFNAAKKHLDDETFNEYIGYGRDEVMARLCNPHDKIPQNQNEFAELAIENINDNQGWASKILFNTFGGKKIIRGLTEDYFEKDESQNTFKKLIKLEQETENPPTVFNQP